MIKTSHFNPTTHSRVCSIHFEDNSFEKDPVVLRSIDWKLDRPKIKADAVPTIKLDSSDDLNEGALLNARGRSPNKEVGEKMEHGSKTPVSKKINRFRKIKPKKCQV